MVDRKAEQVRQLALFADASPREVQWICRTADVVDVAAGRVLALEGERFREVAVVVEGIASSGDGGGEVLLGRGAYYGAAELLAGRPCATTIESRTPVRLLVFGAREFRSLLNRVPSVRLRIPPVVSQSCETERSLRAVS